MGPIGHIHPIADLLMPLPSKVRAGLDGLDPIPVPVAVPGPESSTGLLSTIAAVS